MLYAPASIAYPADLADYPDGEEGYRDPYGQIAAWDERGEPPSFLYRTSDVQVRPAVGRRSHVRTVTSARLTSHD
jgi:hypothetical protein